MPRSSGVYAPPSGTPVISGSVASSTDFNNLADDLGDEITNSIARDGQSPATANLPMGNFKHTGVGDAAARNQYASAGQAQDASLITAGSVSGTDTITASLTPAITSYATGMIVVFKPANTNTSAATCALNGLAAKSIVKYGSTALVAGDLVQNVAAVLVYDGTNFLLLNPQHSVANDEVTYARMQNVSATSRVLGRITAGAGDVEELTPANLLTLLLTVDGSGSGLDADLLDGQSSAAFAAASHSHSNSDLTGYTAADVLAKLITVDGSGSGLDADLLDGQSSAAFASASHTHAASDVNSGTLALARLPVLYACKLAQTQRSSTITQSADPDLSVSVPGSGAYKLELFLNFGAGVGGTQGFDYAFSYSGTGPSPVSRVFQGVVNGSFVSRNNPNVGALGVTEQNTTITTITAGDWLYITGLVNFSTSGTFALTWAQHSSSANVTILYGGSWMTLTKLN